MIKNILIIRFRRVGDAVLSMALCHSLKLTFPQAQIHFVINQHIAPLFQGHPDVDRVIPFNDRENHRLTYIKKVYALMRQTRYDVIIDMRTTPKTLLFSLLSLHTPYRIGRYKWYARAIINHRLRTPEDADRVQSNLHLMGPLAVETKLQKDENFRLYVSESERNEFAKKLESCGIDLKKPVILVSAATRLAYKAWPRKKMEEILRRIIKEYHPQIILNYSGEEEKRVCGAYYEELERDPHIFINVEAQTLRELCALCATSAFFFGNEGGPRHISQALEVPSFAIYPPGIDKDFWLPGQSERYQGISPDDSVPPEHQIDMSYSERMALITVEDVWAGLQPMLDSVIDNRNDE